MRIVVKNLYNMDQWVDGFKWLDLFDWLDWLDWLGWRHMPDGGQTSYDSDVGVVPAHVCSVTGCRGEALVCSCLLLPALACSCLLCLVLACFLPCAAPLLPTLAQDWLSTDSWETGRDHPKCLPSDHAQDTEHHSI